ncbi:type I phosphomannose isomerase catalytic subunit [Anoxynatronum sibiricum]|uniref:Phosphohexomutase n=1 Tax=Anoxynatronum sibiricum TaxID=210623 RepID=A0ABU9VPS0_9CLOT
MQPLTFNHLYFEKIWGGRELVSFRDDLPTGSIGESWDIASHPNGTSTVLDGPFEGKSLSQLYGEKRTDIFGASMTDDRFPLLLKLINTTQALSVQVHPRDDYALVNENDLGKTEAWYVMKASPEAYLIVGTGEIDQKGFRQALDENRVEEMLHRVPVKEGDVFYIQAGLLHAIGPGLIIYEIQQNSDTTYRFYDYGRPRELHVEKAMEVIDFQLEGNRVEGVSRNVPGGIKTQLIQCPYFLLEKYQVVTQIKEKSDPNRFFLFTVVRGTGTLSWEKGRKTLKKGDSLLIPAALGSYSLEGGFELLKSYVPDPMAAES